MYNGFFPCTRFEDQSILLLTGNHYGVKEKKEIDKIEYAMKIHTELHNLYIYICKLCYICLKNNFRLIVENPYSAQHYLVRYFPIKNSLIDKDRTKRGDYYKKPTQFWFVNCKPEYNLIFEVVNNNEVDVPIQRMSDTKSLELFGIKNRIIARSMIHSDYASRFIREFILEQQEE